MSEPTPDEQIGWVTLEEARTLWLDAPVDDDTLSALLEAAYEGVSAYAPTPDPEAPIPASWRLAQVLQARGISRSMTTGREDQYGIENIGVTVYPLDWNVKQLLRPRKAKGLNIR